MAPPVEEAPTKVVKVATTVVRRQLTKTEETMSTTPPAIDDDLHLTVLEESFRNAQSGFETRSAIISHFVCFCNSTCFVCLLCWWHFFFFFVFIFSSLPHRSDHLTGRDEEAAFLSSLKSLWRGFIHMHSVAKLVTKAFPVSGILDNLTEVKWIWTH